jgi:MFS family permease
MSPRSDSRRSPLLFIFLTVFIDLLGFGIVIPLLPVYSDMYGADAQELGLLFGCFSGMQFLFAPMWGRLSDRIGRKPVLVGGLLGTAAAYLLFGLAGSMPLIFLSRLLAGFFGANISTAQAYIADVTTQENRAKGMGLIGAAFGLGFTLGPWVGGELAHVSIHAPGFLAAGLSVSAAVFGFLTLREPEREKRSSSRIFHLEQVRHAFADGRIGLVLLMAFVFIASWSSFESMFLLFGLKDFPAAFHLPTSVENPTRQQIIAAAPIAGRYMGLIGILSAIVQGGLIRRLVPRFGETTLTILGPTFLGAAFVLIGFAPTWAVVIVACALMPLGFGLNNPALAGLVSRASPADEQGAYMGLNQSVLSLARMLGPLFAGFIFKHYSARAPFLVGSAILAVCALIAVYYRARYGATFPRRAAAPVAEA